MNSAYTKIGFEAQKELAVKQLSCNVAIPSERLRSGSETKVRDRRLAYVAFSLVLAGLLTVARFALAQNERPSSLELRLSALGPAVSSSNGMKTGTLGATSSVLGRSIR